MAYELNLFSPAYQSIVLQAATSNGSEMECATTCATTLHALGMEMTALSPYRSQKTTTTHPVIILTQQVSVLLIYIYYDAELALVHVEGTFICSRRRL